MLATLGYWGIMTDMMTRKRITRNFFMGPGSGGMGMSLNSLKIVIPLIVLTLLLQGCGTIFLMGDSREEIIRDSIVWPVYSRFHFDLHVFWFSSPISAFNTGDSLNPSGDRMDVIFYGPWLMIISAADMPIALVITPSPK